MKIPKELIKEYVKSENFTNTTDITYDIQFGNVERPTHKNTSWDQAKFEVCAHKWADLSEDDYGVSILNDCKYGYSIEENVMKISLLKSATYPNPEADRGINEFTYSFYPHKGNFKVGNTIKEGYLLNMPLEASRISKNEGKLSECYSFVSSDKENVIIETIKMAENEDGIIIRLYDAWNKKSDVTLELGFSAKSIWLCDMLENKIEKIGTGDKIKIHVSNFEIITLFTEI